MRRRWPPPPLPRVRMPTPTDVVEALLFASDTPLEAERIREVLAIVAYRQPVSRPELDSIRGVNSDAVLDNLLERRLVRIAGRKEAPGRPFLFETTREFLVAFGLRDLGDLPKVEGELVVPDLAAAEATVDAAAQTEQDPGAGGADLPAGG